jgi:glycosyltransferase involved in cell wall biosynthesis
MGRRLSILELRSVRGTGGGPEKTILFGAECADRTRFAVTVCYIRDDRDDVFGIDARAANLDIDYVEIRERHSFDVRIWPQLKQLVRDRRIDIVHGHDYKTNLLAYLISKRLGVHALATSHGWTGNTKRELWLYYPADKRLLARFKRVIAVSSDIKNDLVRAGARPERVEMMLNAIDPEAFRRNPADVSEVRRALDFKPGEFVIGAVGRLEAQKRFDLLIEAFAPLALEQPRLQLVIVGDGSCRNALETQAIACGIRSQCRFLGHRGDIGTVHHAFDLFVQSSEYEGTPNAVLEAMAMETPLVATDVGGTRDLARPGVEGVIVPAHSVSALRRAIEDVLADPTTARARAVAARRRIETDLSFETRTRRLEAIYDQLAEDRRAGVGGASAAPWAGRA